MNIELDAASDLASDSQPAAPALSATRPYYWSVQREIWENRSVYLGPLFVAAVVLLASFANTVGLPKRMLSLRTLDAAKQHAVVVKPFSMAPAPIMLASFLVGIFYALDALYGERRDRGILFWKSLPVSDATAVLSKATIPIVVLPLIAFVLSVVAVVALLFLSTAVLAVNGISPAVLWGELRFMQQPVIMFYGLVVHSLWFAPIYMWFLMISAWAKRAPILWAVLPLLAVAAVERIAFGTTYFLGLLQYRITGAMHEAFVLSRNELLDQVGQLDPAGFLTAAGLWFGLLFAAVFLYAAVRLRRDREPI